MLSDFRMPSFFDYDPQTGRLIGEISPVTNALTINEITTDDPRSPMSDIERRIALILSPDGAVTYPPGSYDKRFAAAMVSIASGPNASLTSRQRALLWAKVVRYRRQAFGNRVGKFIERAKRSRDPSKLEAALIAAISGILKD